LRAVTPLREIPRGFEGGAREQVVDTFLGIGRVGVAGGADRHQRRGSL